MAKRENRLRPQCNARYAVLLLWQMFSLFLCSSAAAEVSVSARDGVSGAALAGIRINVFEQTSSGDLIWIRNADSDNEGRISLDLGGIEDGRRYILRHRYGDHPSQFVSSAPIPSTGSINFLIGTIQARVSKPDGSHYADESVVLEHLDGSHWRGVHSVVSDSAGRVMFSPAQLGTGARYRLRARSEADGSWKTSAVVDRATELAFTVGGEVLDVAFEHGVSGVRLAGLSAIVFERMADGSSVWRRNIVSDSRGRVLLDLDGLGSGREYFLRHRWGAETGQYADSSLWSEPGPVIFSVGMLRAKLVDGGTGQALGGKSVYLQQRLADGSWETAHTAVTDAGGDVLLNPSRLGTGAVYRLRAQSEVDGSWKHSAMIGSRGTLTFSRWSARGELIGK